MKAVSAVIVIILMLMISVSLAGFAYMFLTTTATSTMESGTELIEQTTSSVLARMKIDSIADNKVYIRNIGKVDLTGFSVYVNDELANISAPSSIAPGQVDSIRVYSLIKENDEIKITSERGTTMIERAPDPCDSSSVVLCLKFDEGSGTTASDSSKYNNDGTLSGTIIGNFENTLDGFSLDCGGVPTSSYVAGKIGLGLKIWSTGGDALACAYKSIGGFTAGYTVFFYGKGYVRAQIYDGSSASYVEDVETGCRTGDGQASMYGTCNSGNPYPEWKLFKLVAFRDSSGASIYAYNNVVVGESNAGFYDFFTDGPVWVDNNQGSALQFDGYDDFVEVLDSDSLDFGTTEDLSILFSVKSLALQNRDIIVKRQDTGTSWILVRQGRFSDDWYVWTQFWQDSSNNYYSPNFNDLSDNGWHDVVVVINRNLAGNEKLKVYFDGEFISNAQSVSGTPDITSSQPLYIARGALSGGYFNGLVDEVRIYNKAIY
jgi:FlaG/FlaF family flagellin (archaellin)